MIKRCNPLAVLVSFNTDVNGNCMHDINFALKVNNPWGQINREGGGPVHKKWTRQRVRNCH